MRSVGFTADVLIGCYSAQLLRRVASSPAAQQNRSGAAAAAAADAADMRHSVCSRRIKDSSKQIAHCRWILSPSCAHLV